MKRFDGFPARMQYTPVPSVFFSSLLPRIDDIEELKVTLYLIKMILAKKGYPRYVRWDDLLSQRSLMLSLGDKPEEALDRAIGKVIERGAILHMALVIDNAPVDAYFLNTEADRKALGKIETGELAVSGIKPGRYDNTANEPLPDIYTLYEQNIGMITPMIADELREAETAYPQGWIHEAIKVASRQNIRKWSYISAILESWLKEGKHDGTHRRDIETGTDKFAGQKYGHVFRR